MSEIGKKLNYPGTKQIGDPLTQRYARKLTRTLDDLKAQLMRSLKNYIDELIENINIEIGSMDHGELTGLQDVEDQLYAFLIDASRAFTAHGPGFSNDTSLADASMYAAVSEYAIKAYVDALLAYILASPLGSIVYVWEDWEENKFIERLVPGQYGQVLTTGGANQKPFWSWVWQEPGADFGGKIYYRVWMYAYVRECSIISMDVENTVQAGGLTSIQRDSIDDTDYFNGYRHELDASVLDASIITMDETKQIEASMNSSYKFPLMIHPNDSVGLTDAVTIVISLEVNVFDSLSVTDYVEGSVS